MQLNSHPRYPHPHPYSRCLKRLFMRIPMLLLIFACSACTDPLFHNDDLPVKVPSVSDAHTNTVTGYLHPAQMDLENEDSGGKLWQACKASPDLQVALDAKNSLLLFRSARSLELLNVWDVHQECHSGFGRTQVHQDYDFQVLEVQLNSDFLKCISMNTHGIYYKIRLK